MVTTELCLLLFPLCDLIMLGLRFEVDEQRWDPVSDRATCSWHWEEHPATNDHLACSFVCLCSVDIWMMHVCRLLLCGTYQSQWVGQALLCCSASQLLPSLLLSISQRNSTTSIYLGDLSIIVLTCKAQYEFDSSYLNWHQRPTYFKGCVTVLFM